MEFPTGNKPRDLTHSFLKIPVEFSQIISHL